MSAVRPAAEVIFDAQVPVLIVGAGAAGLCAALAAAEAGADTVVLERDAVPAGSTALSAGLIPAAATRFQRVKGIRDSAEQFAADILHKAAHEPDARLVRAVAAQSGALVEWLADAHGLPFDVVDDFNYPGHAAFRMHGLPSRSGSELIDRLRAAVEGRGIPLLCGRRAVTLFADPDGRIRGIEAARGDGQTERIGCAALVLACNGYGGNRDLVRRHVPDMADALDFGHGGNQGEAILWGEALGAELRHLSGYQGHGSVATPHNILITWAAVMEGGFQVNRDGSRFSNEAHGYSEQAAQVLRQPGGVAFSVFDERIATIARQFLDFRNAETAGAIATAPTLDGLADAIKVSSAALAATMTDVDACKLGARDRFGRDFSQTRLLASPYRAVKVTGALFHTQGGLAVDTDARVLRIDGTAFPNLFAAGGAAAGLSGSTAAGYLSGNGLLTATVLGRIAGASAARQVQQP